MNNIEESYNQIKMFNDLAGQLESPSNESIALQLDLIQEEYLEGVEAFDNDDKIELLDAACDMYVVVSGLLQKLEAQGYDVDKALKLVCENNMSKFTAPPDMEYACANEYALCYTERPELSEGYSLSEIKDMPKYQFWYYTDGNGKLRKPPGFKPVDISDCVPKEVV